MSNYDDSKLGGGEEGQALAEELAEQTEAGFVAESSGSPGRSASLLLIGLLAIGAVALYVMRLKAGPSAASAATPAAASAEATINEFLTDGGRNLRQMHDLLRNTEQIVQQFATYPSLKQVPVEELRTNPFCLDIPKAAVPAVDVAAEQARKEKEQVLKEVQKLKLQSVLHSAAVHACMISGKMYTEGQEIEGFLVERIAPNSVIVRKGNYRLELKMRR